jgi:cell wall-associated NlpC family hydrolase
MSRYGRHVGANRTVNKSPLVLAAAFLGITGVVLVQTHNVLAKSPTLGAANHVDTSTQAETLAAKQTVTQYLAVRDAHNATVASRSRAISQARNELAAAQGELNKLVVNGYKVVRTADNYAGVRYVSGGSTPNGFDCSGYTKFVFNQLGIDLPRVASDQFDWATQVSESEARVGDLVFFHSASGVYHVGIYAGKNTVWHAPYPGKSVEKKRIWTKNITYGTVPKSALNATQAKKVAAARAALAKAKKMKVTPLTLPVTK